MGRNVMNTLALALSLMMVAGVVIVMIPGETQGAYVGNITINSDGTVTPSDAPIKVRNSVYYLKKDMNGGITIFRSGIVFNGMGRTIQGSGSGFGISIAGTSMSTITDVTIMLCKVVGFVGGIRLDYADENLIVFNEMTGNVNAGLAIMNYCDNNVVKFNEIDDNQYGIAVANYCTYNEFRYNIIHDNTDYGARFYLGSNYNTIEKNVITDHASYGIWLYYCGYNVVNKNYIETVVNSTYSGSTGGPVSAKGIGMEYGLGGHTVTNNIVIDVGFVGILSRSNNNVVEANCVTDCFLGTACWFNDGTKILENHVWDCQRPGINVEDSTNIRVIDNTVKDCKHGIYLSDATLNLNRHYLIEGNVFKDNYYGIKIGDPTCGGATFHHNDIIDNTYQLSSETDVSNNVWNDGGGEGNYWSDYSGQDTDYDGVGDTNLPHAGVDYYPLMDPCN